MVDVTAARAGVFFNEDLPAAQVDTSWYVQPPTLSAPGTFAEAEWLLGLQTTDGAIVENPGSNGVFPYMAHYAAIGLARAAEYTRNPVYGDSAWAWLFWYAERMDATTGYVNDYHGSSGAWVSDNHMDSTDAYAGMYLVALYKTYLATQRQDHLTSIATSISLALTAIESTQQENGLTFALPGYDAWYLEDNIEALTGARAAVTLAAALNNTTLRDRAQAISDALARGIGEMWNAETGVFDYAIFGNQVRARNDWTDQNSQRQMIWSLGWGAAPPASVGMMDAYDAHIDWSHQGGGVNNDTYEVMALWALRRLGRDSELNAAIASLTAIRDTNNRAYPWTVVISGIYILGALGLGSMPVLDIPYPGGTNLLPNPSLTLDGNADGLADGISVYGGPGMSLHPANAGNYQQMVNDGTEAIMWDPVPVQAARYYTFSIYRKLTALAAGAQAKIEIDLLAVDGSTLVTYGYDLSSAGVVDGSVARWWWTQYVPIAAGADPQAVYARCTLGVQSGSGTMQLAAPKFEQAGNPTSVPGGPITW